MTARPSVFFRTPLTCIPAAILRRTDGAGRWCRRRCNATTRDNARRGAIYDARCRNGTTRPRHCVGRCTRRCGGRREAMHVGAPFMTPGAGTARPVRGIALGGVRGGAGKLRYCGGPTGRHKCRPYVAGCSSAILRRSSGRHKCRPYGAGCSSTESRRSSGRHKCRPYVAGCSSTILRRTDRATQVSPLR